MKRNINQAGFTIIELTISTAIFSVVLLVIAAGILNFTKSYIKGVHQSQTQETTRQIMSEISQALEFSASFNQDPNNTASLQTYCLGNIKYTFRINQRYQTSDTNQADHAIVRAPTSAGGNCQSSNNFDRTTDRELIGNNMQLRAAGTSPVIYFDPTTNTYVITLIIVYGDDDLINDDGSCKSVTGNEYCASAKLTATVQRRLL